jgi:Ca2+-binding EF-hand superfamily protein
VDKDRSGTITAQELAQVQFGGKPLGVEAATKFIKVFDRDRSMNVDFNEYAALHAMLEKLSNAFYQADVERAGSLDSRQLFNSLNVQTTSFHSKFEILCLVL